MFIGVNAWCRFFPVNRKGGQRAPRSMQQDIIYWRGDFDNNKSAEQLSIHLAGHGVDLSALTWQTDNGGEFFENQDEQGLPATVRALGSNHRYLPPKHYPWQSDVETVVRLVEDEFFDRETFTGQPDFWAKVTTYWHYFSDSSRRLLRL